MKRALNIGIWTLLIGGIFTLLGFIDKQQKAVVCNGLAINIDHHNGNFFVTEEDVRQDIKNLGYEIDQQSICEIDLQTIEGLLNHNAAIKKADVYRSIDGKVSIDITQRQPLVRIFSKNGESYYIDVEGALMPLSRKYTSRVLVANGNINEPYALRYHTNMAALTSFDNENDVKCILHDLYALAKFVDQNAFWKAQVTQIFINEQREIEIIPRVGNHSIVLGTADRLEDKFEKLMDFYERGLAKTGWNEYKTINLKYKNQVVCTKKTNYGI